MKEEIKEGLILICVGIIEILIYAFLVTWFWNAIIPVIFASVGISTITYWQSVGLIMLCRILFKKVTE